MDDVVHMVDRVFGLDLRGQGQQPLEHDRHQMQVGDPLFGNGPQDVF